MTLKEFVELLERIDKGEEPHVPFNLHSGIRKLNQSTPDEHSSIHHDWGLPAWARFFREVAAVDYSEVVTP
ncbi:MAG: hypothetical protein KAX80_14445 [Planctomycetes bacterium]|nr:hypothetical protein [Planctomycetota bacterium]